MFVTEMFDTTMSIKCESKEYLSFNVVISICGVIILILDTWTLAGCFVYTEV